MLQAFNAAADAARSGNWSQTAVDPAVVCDAGDLYHMPCAAGQTQQCNAIARGVFGHDTGNRSAPQDVLPPRTVSMVPGEVWEYQRVCREILGAPGVPACDGGSVACWKGITACGWKSKVVGCGGGDVRHYRDVCAAHRPGSKAPDRAWTCCVRTLAEGL